jgi:hypothetical protein
MQNDEDLAPLSSRDDFKDLLDELNKKRQEIDREDSVSPTK